MTIVRPFHDKDKPYVHRMYAASGFGYQEPEWDEMILSAVVEVDGSPTMAAFLRQTATVYMVMDSAIKMSKRGRLGQFLILNRELLMPAQKLGITEVEAFVPPSIDDSFGKVLLHVGWQRNLWPCYSRIL